MQQFDIWVNVGWIYKKERRSFLSSLFLIHQTAMAPQTGRSLFYFSIYWLIFFFVFLFFFKSHFVWKSIDGVAIWNDLLHNSSEPKTSSNIFHIAKREKWNKNTVEQGRRTHKTQNSDVGARRRRYGITFWTETSAPSPPPYNNNIISKDIESDLCHEKRSCCCSYFVDGTSYPRVLFFWDYNRPHQCAYRSMPSTSNVIILARLLLLYLCNCSSYIKKRVTVSLLSCDIMEVSAPLLKVFVLFCLFLLFLLFFGVCVAQEKVMKKYQMTSINVLVLFLHHQTPSSPPRIKRW